MSTCSPRADKPENNNGGVASQGDFIHNYEGRGEIITYNKGTREGSSTKSRMVNIKIKPKEHQHLCKIKQS